MRCVTAKFVPRLLTVEQKDDRVSICTDLRDRAQNDPNFMSSQWSTSSSPRPKKARQVKSNIKTMLIAFFNIDGLVHHELVPTGQTVNKEFFKTVLHRFRDAVRRLLPENWRSWILHHDNAPAHNLPTPRTLLRVTSSCSQVEILRVEVVLLIGGH